MIWYILTAISAIMFFGFVILGVVKFGLLDCYSAYGPKWQPDIHSKINWWTIVTFLSAALIVPVLLFGAEGNPYQFLGFLAPISLALVAATPDYKTNTFSMVLHQVGAIGSAILIILFVIAVPKLLWVVIALAVIACILGLIKKGTILFWLEMAMYLSTYIIVFIMLKGIPAAV